MVYVRRTTSSLRIYFKASVYSKISFHNKGLAYSVVVRKMLEEPPAFQTFKLFYKSWCILDSILRLKRKQQTKGHFMKVYSIKGCELKNFRGILQIGLGFKQTLCLQLIPISF